MAEGTAESTGAELPALTSLRFLAALMVVSYHYLAFLEWRPTVIAHGDLGVSFFFILSGFILSHVYAARGLERPVARRRFALARLGRIYPAYLFAFALALPAVIHRGMSYGFTHDDLAAFVLGPLSLHAWLPGAGCVVNCPGWSISVEFFFYALFPLLLGPVQRRPWAWFGVTLGWWAAASGIALWLLGRSMPVDAAAATRLEQLIGYFPPMRLPEFLAGMVLHALLRRRSRPLPWPGLALAGLIGLALVELAAAVLPKALLNNGFSAVLWMPLILAGARARSGLLCHPVAVFLGRISYALYLLHSTVAIYLDYIDRRIFGGLLGADALYLAAAQFGLAIGAAAAVHLILEEPLRGRIGSWGAPRPNEAMRSVA